MRKVQNYTLTVQLQNEQNVNLMLFSNEYSKNGYEDGIHRWKHEKYG